MRETMIIFVYCDNTGLKTSKYFRFFRLEIPHRSQRADLCRLASCGRHHIARPLEYPIGYYIQFFFFLLENNKAIINYIIKKVYIKYKFIRNN